LIESEPALHHGRKEDDEKKERKKEQKQMWNILKAFGDIF